MAVDLVGAAGWRPALLGLPHTPDAKRPTLSPDRNSIAFDGGPPGKAPLSDFDMEIVRRDGTGLKTLTRSPHWAIDVQWSPNGTLLSFSRFPSHQVDTLRSFIWTVRRDGSEPRRIVRGFGARWSPDGKQLASPHRLTATCL